MRLQILLKMNLEKKQKFLKQKVFHEIKPFGEGRERIMSQIQTDGDFCVYINSENYKFDAFHNSEDVFGLALHIAECVMREVTRHKNPSTSQKVKLMKFYQISIRKVTKN